MFSVTRAMEKALLQHFIHQKVAIAYAINKPFPFFEALRDRDFITERMYKESLEACQNLVPVPRVVHNVLTQLEKTFELSLLVTLFSKINLHSYPNLVTIFKSFRNVSAAYEEWSRTTPVPPRALSGPAEGNSLGVLLLPPLPQLPPPSHPSCASQASCQQMDKNVGEPPSPPDPALSLPGLSQEGGSPPAVSGKMPSCAPGAVKVKREESPEPSGPEAPQEAPSTPPNKKAKKRKRNIWYTPKRKRPKKSFPQEPVETETKVSLKKSPGKKQKKKSCGWSDSGGGQRTRPQRGAASRRQAVPEKAGRKNDSTRDLKVKTRTREARTRRDRTSRPEEIPEEDTVDFLSPTLPVTCGKAKGILHQEKAMQGSSEKCIQNEEGAWLSPREFVNSNKNGGAKDWKNVVYCNGKSLRYLQKKGLVFCKYKVNPKKKSKSK